MTGNQQDRPPFPPFTRETATQKVRMAEDGWNTRDPEKVALAYTVDSTWRNRSEFFSGREAIVQFLRRKWAKELDYRRNKGGHSEFPQVIAHFPSTTTRMFSYSAMRVHRDGSMCRPLLFRSILCLLALLEFLSCSGSVSLVGTTTTVRFVYAATTALNPSVHQQFPKCVEGVGHTHIHPSWQNYARINMSAFLSDRWEISFTDVPVGPEQRIRISDPNTCATDPNGASTVNVRANDVLLTQVVDTPGNGMEPGLAFRVAADGHVTP